jgi:hypothetical protein
MFGETFGAATGVSAPSDNGGFADGMDFLGRVSGDGSRGVLAEEKLKAKIEKNRQLETTYFSSQLS